jgi:ribonuclease HI
MKMNDITSPNTSYTIYTDWSCIGNPWYGWRAAVILDEQWSQIVLLSDGCTNVTNNQMELLWAISALQWCNQQWIRSAKLITDSQYVKNGIESRISNRKRNGRRTAARKPVANQWLWMELDKQVSLTSVQRWWTKWHANNKRNNLVDVTAFAESEQKKNQQLPYSDIVAGGLFR